MKNQVLTMIRNKIERSGEIGEKDLLMLKTIMKGGRWDGNAPRLSI